MSQELVAIRDPYYVQAAAWQYCAMPALTGS